MRKGITFINGHGMRDTITRIQHDSSCSSRCIQRQHSLNSNVHCRGVECLKHNLSHFLSVSFRVKRSFGQKYRVLFRGNPQFIVESVMPDFFHIIPVCDNTVLDWVLQSQNTALALCFITNISIFLSHTNHNSFVSGSAYNRREDSSWSVITSKSSFAHTRSVIYNQSLHFFFITSFFTHTFFFLLFLF